MNLATFRSRVARVSGLSSTLTSDLSLIDGWVNDAIEQFNRETKMNVVKASMSVTADQADYTLDTDILAMQAAYYAPADAQSALLVPLAPEVLVERRLFQTGEETPPRYYALAGASTIMLWPSPQASTETIHILYVPRHTALATTADTPSATANGNIPEEYHVVLEAYAKWKACEAEDHRPSQFGKAFHDEWVTGLGQARADAKRKAGVQMPQVLVGRPRHIPVLGNGIDIR